MIREPGKGERLWQRWTRNAAEAPSREAIIHLRAGEPSVRITWAELLGKARAAAARLAAAGVRRGDVCALILRHHPEVYPLYLGISALGAIPSFLAYPNARLHPDKLVQGLSGMARRSGLDWVLTERALEATVSPLVRGEGSSVRGVFFPLDWGALDPSTPFEAPDGSDAEPCLLQHSSGTTGLQKAVVLSHRAVLDHLERYAEAIGLSPSDKVASWLPLYHDMGLIAAFHLPLASGVPSVQIDPFEWISAPYLLFEAIAREGATIAWLPNFAYNFAAGRVDDEEMEGLRLDTVRLLVNCSEPVRAESHQVFAERFARFGLRAGALGASYAMAETTFAVTQTPPGERARELVVSRVELARGRVVLARGDELSRTCVSSGVPLRGVTVTVVAESGEALPEGFVGELRIASESMFDGYRNDPERTAEVLEDGCYWSGDLGFVREGEVYVAGRKKDTIIVAGKNLYPEDIEDAVGAVPGVTPGRVVAFGVEDANTGTESVWVVAESDASEAEHKALRVAIQRAGMAIDVTIARALVAPPRWLVKSSSGKPSRKANKERALAGELAEAREKA